MLTLLPTNKFLITCERCGDKDLYSNKQDAVRNSPLCLQCRKHPDVIRVVASDGYKWLFTCPACGNYKEFNARSYANTSAKQKRLCKKCSAFMREADKKGKDSCQFIKAQ